MAIQYDRKQITAWLDAYTVAKSRDYVQAVSDLQWQGDDILVGKVQGTRSRPYNVRIWFNDPDDDLWIESECSCPVGGHCKHVAALLFACLTHVPRQAITGVRPELVSWLEGFRTRNLVTSAAGQRATPRPSHALAYVIADAYEGHPQILIYKSRVSSDGTIRSLDDA